MFEKTNSMPVKPGLDSEISCEFFYEKSPISLFIEKTSMYIRKDFLTGLNV